MRSGNVAAFIILVAVLLGSSSMSPTGIACAAPTSAPLGSPESGVAEGSGEHADASITATFFDTDIREAIAELALQADVNIAVDPSVTGTVSLDLIDVPVERALRLVLAGGGYAFRRVDDFYIVGLADPRNRVFGDLAEAEVYVFKSISASTARFLTPTAYEPFVKFDSERDIAVISAPRETINRLVALFDKIDADRPQIRVKALVTEVRSEVVREWGIDSFQWELEHGQAVKPDWTALLSLASGSIGLDTDVFGRIAAKIRALERDDRARVNADPVIIISDGKTGSLFVGDRYNLVIGSETTTTPRVEKIEAGTELKVTPRVRGQQIELELSQKVSYFTDKSTFGPVVRAAEFSSVVRITPGQTLLIAGLSGKDLLDRETKTPVLGDIPLIRLLFKRAEKQQVENELLVFITAEVVK
ncbi:MAG: secretin and TonB N-terminal domain-containing protein [Clostridia bacterium]|nr:secretin and TonB N-terminal domain-containing protein [Clostridia bacterium]